MVRRIIKFVLIVTLIIGLISITIYSLLISPRFANNLKIISLRKSYIKLVDKYNFLKPAIIVLSQEKTGDKRYWYSLHGNIIKVDDTNIYLKGMDGNIYSFVIDWQEVNSQYVQSVVLTKEGKDAPELFVSTFDLTDINRSVINGKLYNPNDYYDVVWHDTKNLTEILNQSSQDPNNTLNILPEQVKLLYSYE